MSAMQQKAPSSALPLNHESADKYKKLVNSGKVGEELNKAYEYVDSLPEMVPKLYPDARQWLELYDDTHGVLACWSQAILLSDLRARSPVS